MLNRPLNAVLVRLAIVASALALLLLVAPVAFATTEKFPYAENGTDPIARFTATDEDGDEITWGVEGDDSALFSVSDAGVLSFKESPSFETRNDMNKDNVYEVTVTATAKTKSTQDVEVTVTDVDEAGKVTLSQPQPQVSRPLEASGPGDPDAPVEDERWQWSRGPNADGPWTAIEKATAQSRPPVAADEGMYLLATVTYTDKFGAGKTASMVSEYPVEARTVANAAPSFADHDTNDDTTDGVQAARAVNEGAKGANVGKPLSATDSDGDVLLYEIAAAGSMNDGAGGGDTAVTNIRDLFSIDSRSGQIKTKVDTLNSDDSGDTDPDDTNGEVTYTITVTAKDPSGAPGTATVTVTITDVNDKPAFPEASLKTHTIAEAATTLVLGAVYDATDADAGDDVTGTAELTYGVTGADASAFTIGNGADLNDDGDATDANEALGQLALKKTPNFETKSSYSVTVTATDDENATAELKVTVTVTNAEDNGTVGLTQREPQVGRSVVASLSDEDGSISGASWQWYRNATATTDNTALAGVTAECADDTDTATLCSIPKATGPSYTPVAADAVSTGDTAARLAVRVTYTDKHVTDDDGTAGDDGDSALAVTQADVQVSDPANTAPKFADDQDPNTAGNQADAVRSVAENEDKASVGDAVTATDANGDLLIYSLGGADAMYFTIDSGLKSDDTEGQIKTAMKLDHETKSQYMVVVTTTDPSGATDTINVMINVTDADDPPMITGDNAYTVPENTMDAVETFSASDQDGDEVTWDLEGDDAALFSISDAGVLSFKDSPSFETRNDKDKDNVYKVTVTASSMAKSTQAVEVTVTDVDEAGKVTLSQPQPQVGRTVTADGPGDPDAPVDDEKWQWSRSPSMDGPWTDIDKATSNSRTPAAADEGMYLRATVTYTDKFGAGKTASMVSEYPVEARTVANAAPSFADHDTNDDTTDGVQAARAVNEGAKGANVGKPLSATDSDGDVLLYEIAAAGSMNDGAGGGDTAVTNIRDLFSIDSRSGQIKTKVDTLNSDDSGDTDPDDTNGEVTYTITVTAKDPSGAPGTATVTVTITDVNDKPAFPEASLKTHTIAEAATTLVLGAVYDATDADAGDDVTGTAELTYGVTGADASAFTIGNGADLNDDGDATDANEALGQLALKKTPNFETKSSYSVTVTATDDENATAELKVTVTVTNAEDNGTVGLTQREPQVGRSVVASLSDEDGSISGASWQWYRNATATTDNTALAGVTAECADDTDTATLCSIPKATGPSYTPVAADAVSTGDTAARLAVRVTYTDKHVTDDDGTAGDDGDSALAVTQADVQVSDPANTAPKFADDQDPNTAGNQADAVRSVAENEDKASVGDAVTATDANGDLLIYTLSGADAMYFTIDSGLKSTDTEGQIKTAMKLDYEMKKMHMVVVTATDPSGASDSINVMIMVTDEDDPPTITPITGPAPEDPVDTCGGATAGTSLVADCRALLDSMPVLVGDGEGLNWHEDTPLADWDGVSVNNGRVSNIYLRSHGLMGTIPDRMNDLTGLVRLQLHDNDLTGEIPDLSGLDNLEWLILGGNAFSGGIPATLGGMESLERLWLHRNEGGFEGGIPSELAGATSLVRIYLYGNGLTGEIPAELGDLPRLRYLMLHNNELTGGIPSELGNAVNMKALYLYNNMLSGSIPAELGNMVDAEGESVRLMYLHDNMLSGDVPAELGNLTSLTRLLLRGNMLTGCVPAAIADAADNDRSGLSACP